MSAYLQLLTPMTDEECLLAALLELGFDLAQLEVFATPVTLQRYRGETPARANIVLRRGGVRGGVCDVGFLASPTGYRAVVNDMDTARFGAPWLSSVHARYQSHWASKQQRLAMEERVRVEEENRRLVEAQRQAVLERAKKMGYQVKEAREGDTVRLVLVKRTY